MKLCIPVTKDEGLSSPVCGHFGSAPLFLMIDSETLEMNVADNRNADHEHGKCQPLVALGNHEVHALLVGGIGAGALSKLAQRNIQVYRAVRATAREAVEDFKAGVLKKVDPAEACAHHGHSHG